jgi:hypothetical protein
VSRGEQIHGGHTITLVPPLVSRGEQIHGGHTITFDMQRRLQQEEVEEQGQNQSSGFGGAAAGYDPADGSMMISGGGGKPELGEDEAGSDEGGSNLLQTVFSIVNISIGPIGMLGVPFCFKECGWLAVLALFVMAVAMLYTALLLDEIQQQFPELEDYLDIGEAALGPRGRLFVTVMVFIDMLSTCCTFLIVEGTNLYQLHPDDSGGWTRHRYILTSALVVLPTCWIKNLNGLTRLNVLGSVIS